MIAIPQVMLAQPAGYKAVVDLEQFKKQYSTEAAKIQSIVSDFTQEKHLTALTEKITSSGKFHYKRTGKVRIEYVKPFTYLMVMNGYKMKVKDSEKENTVQLNSNKLFQQVNRIMTDCVQGTIMDSKDFTSKVFENDKTYLLEMTPVSKTLKSLFSTITLIVEKGDFSAKSIVMNEPSGNKTIITFTNKKLNQEVSEALFNI